MRQRQEVQGLPRQAELIARASRRACEPKDAPPVGASFIGGQACWS
nr:hypothetical protein [Paucibacter sp. B51]